MNACLKTLILRFCGPTIALNFVWSLDLKVNYHIQASALKMVGMGVRRALLQPINLEKKKIFFRTHYQNLSKKLPFCVLF